MYILDKPYLQIELLGNKLIYYSDMNICPTRDELLDIENVLLNFFEKFIEKKEKFIQIMNVNNTTISCLVSFYDTINAIKKIYCTEISLELFNNYLICTVIIIDNKFIKNAIQLGLNTYNNIKPIHIISNLDEIDNIEELKD